jgi:hypothetical protein
MGICRHAKREVLTGAAGSGSTNRRDQDHDDVATAEAPQLSRAGRASPLPAAVLGGDLRRNAPTGGADPVEHARGFAALGGAGGVGEGDRGNGEVLDGQGRSPLVDGEFPIN